MDFGRLFSFLLNDFLFSFTIIVITFILGWFLYNNIILRKINLKESLFEKDNLAAWIEFIGAFVFPTLYLGAKAVEGSVSDNIWLDLLISAAFVVVYILLFTILRLLSGLIVNYLNAGDGEGKVNFNNEIYGQKNIAASLFSIVLSVMFVNIIQYLDFIPGFLLVSLLKISVVLIFTFVSFIVYSLILSRKTTLFKEIFVDNNPAAGTDLVGFIYAVGVILNGVITYQPEFDFYAVIATALISLIIFGILSILLKVLFSWIVKVDTWKEVYEQNNIGAALGQASLYIGIAYIIIHFMK